LLLGNLFLGKDLIDVTTEGVNPMLTLKRLIYASDFLVGRQGTKNS